MAEGRLSLDDAVLSFFPDEAPADPSPHLAAMRLRHLLSMSTGHDADTTGRMREGEGGDWGPGLPGAAGGTRAGDALCLQQRRDVPGLGDCSEGDGADLAGLSRPAPVWAARHRHPTWENSPQGINVGGWGLSVTTEDIARFGLLYLQKGEWRGKRLLPEEWVAEATSKQVSNGDGSDNDWAQGYGFQFWRCRHNAYRGDGAFGQLCVVLPEQEAVVAITAGTSDLGGVLNLIWEHLLPAMAPTPLPEDADAQETLRARLESLSLPAPEGKPASPLAATASGKTFAFDASEDNEHKIETARWDFRADGATMTLQSASGLTQIEANATGWQRGTTTFGGSDPARSGVQGAWAADDTYVLTAYFSETPFAATFTARFTEAGVQLDIRQNVSFGPTARPPLEGCLV